MIYCKSTGLFTSPFKQGEKQHAPNSSQELKPHWSERVKFSPLWSQQGQLFLPAPSALMNPHWNTQTRCKATSPLPGALPDADTRLWSQAGAGAGTRPFHPFFYKRQEYQVRNTWLLSASLAMGRQQRAMTRQRQRGEASRSITAPNFLCCWRPWSCLINLLTNLTGTEETNFSLKLQKCGEHYPETLPPPPHYLSMLP